MIGRDAPWTGRYDETAYLHDYAAAAWATVEDLAAAPLDAPALLLARGESGMLPGEVRAVATALLGEAMLHDRPNLEAARLYFRGFVASLPPPSGAGERLPDEEDVESRVLAALLVRLLAAERRREP